MTISKNRPLCSLKFPSGSDYSSNLDTLCDLIAATPDNALAVAPEVCLTGFDYDRFDAAADFAPLALERLHEVCGGRIVVLTLIERRDGGIYNVARVLHGGRVLHEQAKCRLFKLGDEHRYFAEGGDEAVQIVEVDGLRLGVLICFELRFKALWQRLEGCDVIAVPAQWGKIRAAHFVTLTEALAVMNQCYVVASDGDNPDTSGQGGVITPFGEASRNGNTPCLTVTYDDKTVQTMRRYLDVGLS